MGDRGTEYTPWPALPKGSEAGMFIHQLPFGMGREHLLGLQLPATRSLPSMLTQHTRNTPLRVKGYGCRIDTSATLLLPIIQPFRPSSSSSDLPSCPAFGPLLTQSTLTQPLAKFPSSFFLLEAALSQAISPDHHS